MRSLTLTAAALGLASTTLASIASTCPETDVCYQLNVPSNTASAGTGDIFFQLSASTSYSWIALGQGSQMAGSNIFVMYTSSSGTNVTVSPRLGTGHVQPQHDTDAQITLLAGSGVSNGRMTANVRCSNCGSWSGGTMDFTGSSSNWIHAYKSGSALNSDDLGESISQHDDAAAFTWDLSQAKGGSDVNPFTSSVATATSIGTAASASCTPLSTTASSSSATLAEPSGSGCPTAWPSQYSTSWPTAQPTWASSCYASGHGSWPTNAPWANNQNGKRDDSCPSGTASTSSSSSGDSTGNSSGDSSSSAASFSNAGYSGLSLSKQNSILFAHGALAALAFVALFPIGGLIIRLANFTGAIWVHVALQVFAYIIYIIGFGLGVYMATNLRLMSNSHPVIGIVLFVVLLGQPILGLLHHRLFKKYGHRTLWSYAHLSVGRIAILLGIINGGLGLRLAGESKSKTIAYAVIAAIVGVVYIVCVVFGEVRRKGKTQNEPPAYDLSQKEMHDLSGSGSNDSVQGPNHEFYGSTGRPPVYEGA
ncbi:hypothetical protein LTR85_000604 [Meristemomyces frigidus]|nr:hypothetical protein LTR85_000604 [Meristemomyces frigidus]